LLSIAAQYDHEDLAKFLLTYWKECDKDKWDIVEGELSVEAKVFKTNPNSRDLKGWSCCCIAVFHESKKVLRLLLEHGADPNLRSSYNKNAWDLAKDELDAAEKVVRSRAEIRQVLLDHDPSGQGATIFGTGKVVNGTSNLYKDLDHDGTAMVMNIEMNAELSREAAREGGKKEKKKGATAGSAGGGGKEKKKEGGGKDKEKGSANAAKKK